MGTRFVVTTIGMVFALGVSTAFAFDLEDEHAMESMGAVQMTIRCPDILPNFELADALFDEMKRRRVRHRDGPLDDLFMAKALDGERRVKAGETAAYCAEMERDYGPGGRIYPDMVIERRR